MLQMHEVAVPATPALSVDELPAACFSEVCYRRELRLNWLSWNHSSNIKDTIVAGRFSVKGPPVVDSALIIVWPHQHNTVPEARRELSSRHRHPNT